jgi:hypothetical protein
MLSCHEQAARELEVRVSEQEHELNDLHSALGLVPSDVPRSPRPGSVPPSPRGTMSGAKDLTPHQAAAQENLLLRLRAEVKQRCAGALPRPAALPAGALPLAAGAAAAPGMRCGRHRQLGLGPDAAAARPPARPTRRDATIRNQDQMLLDQARTISDISKSLATSQDSADLAAADLNATIAKLRQQLALVASAAPARQPSRLGRSNSWLVEPGQGDKGAADAKLGVDAQGMLAEAQELLTSE